MSNKIILFYSIILTVGMCVCPLADASVIFNEILSDPASGLSGDSNNDGVRSGTQDEFLELFNKGLNAVNISGWMISDSVSVRHIFPVNSMIDAQSFLVVFGGGSPDLPGVNWQNASSGSLGLNNAGDTVTLKADDGTVMDQVAYGSVANFDQSIGLSPDGEGPEFLKHSTIELSEGSLFSPGTSLDGRLTLANLQQDEIPDEPVVPELPTLAYFALGWAPLIRNFRP